MADVSDKSLEKSCRKMKEGGVCVYVGYWKSGKLFSQRIKAFGSFGIHVEAWWCSVPKWH